MIDATARHFAGLLWNECKADGDPLWWCLDEPLRRVWIARLLALPDPALQPARVFAGERSA